MRYGSVCSGIEAATVAWEPLGWQPAFFAEIAKFHAADDPRYMVLGNSMAVPVMPRIGDRLQRNAIPIELNADYVRLARSRIDSDRGPIAVLMDGEALPHDPAQKALF